MKLDIKTIQAMKKYINSGYEDIKIKFLYHSNKIEGSVLTEKALSALITQGIVDQNQEDGVLTLNDLNESLNSGYVFDYVIDTLGTPLAKEELCKWHEILMRNTSWEKENLSGKYKMLPNTILGANIEVSTIDDVHPLMAELLEEISNNDHIVIDDIAYYHARFEHIHPFQDGNGRIGRFIIMKQCIENDLDLIALNDDYKNKYYQSLELAQISKYYKPLIELFNDCQKELDRSLEKMLPIIETYKKFAHEK